MSIEFITYGAIVLSAWLAALALIGKRNIFAAAVAPANNVRQSS